MARLCSEVSRELRMGVLLAFVVICCVRCFPSEEDPDPPPPPPDPRCGESGCQEVPASFRNDRCLGACDREAGLVCAGDRCVCGDGGTLCASACVDPSTDPMHCGRCDKSCGEQACLDGVCDCPDGESMCEEQCRTESFYAYDQEHCGACDTKCFGSCRAGECLTVVDIAAGPTTSAALMSDGSVWLWGDNSFGQHGVPPEGDYEGRSPSQVPGVEGAIEVSLGDWHGCALTEDDSVWCWGHGPTLALGPNADLSSAFSPAVVVPGLEDVKSISVGRLHSCALTDDGRVYTWGTGASGQLGSGSSEHRLEPAQIPGVYGVEEVICNESATCIRDANGVQCVGNLARFRGSTDNYITFELVPISLPELPRQFDFSDHFCAVTGPDGETALTCFGRNDDGQVSHPASETAGRTTVPHFAGNAPPVQIVTGYTSTCARGTDGAVVCWGANNYGQLAWRFEMFVEFNGVNLSADAIDLTGSAHHYCALLVTGKIECWGWNPYNQVTSRTYHEHPEPTQAFPW